jgi:hypothetical protein
LEVPGFVKDSVVAGFDNARVQVEIPDVLIRCCIAKENAGEVVAVEFALAGASAFHADLRAKGLEVCDVGFASVPTFIGSLVSCQVNEPVVKIHGV